MYRADLLEKAGYTGKLETLDDWEAALTALKEYGVEKPMVVQSLEYLMRFMGSAYGIRAGMYVDDQTGEIKNGYTQEAYKELRYAIKIFTRSLPCPSVTCRSF
jgi:putative aldouronate transport system substrate-binding protein